MVKEKLLDQVHYAIRVRHLSYRTEKAYLVPERKVHSGTILDFGLRILD